VAEQSNRAGKKEARMPSTNPETAAPARSCWTIDYWLRHCEGYRVWDATGPIGYVVAVLMTEEDKPHSLVVRVESAFSVLVTLPSEAVEGVDPATERVFVALTVPTREHETRQLRIPAFA
jgi:hypothetical protein